MIGFLLKKTLYDLWDNMFRIVALNVGFLLLISFPVFLPGLIGRFFASIELEMLITAIGILACSIYLSGAAFAIRKVSDYSAFGVGDFIKGIKTAWPAGLVMGIFIFVVFFVITVIIPFYMSIESLVGLMLGMAVFWLTVFAVISFQFYFTVYNRLGSNIKKSFKKCTIISLDNTGLAVFMFFHNLVVLALSALLAFIFPGPAGILLYLDQALRLRLLKYDWLEANPGANRRKIPWDAILIEERERTGHRTLKNFIFPWKD